MVMAAAGVRREEWKQILRQRVSRASMARAEEQKAMEQARKVYEEEEEEEGEMTDAGMHCIHLWFYL